MDGEKVLIENFYEQICNEGENDCMYGMYEWCYGDYFFEYDYD